MIIRGLTGPKKILYINPYKIREGFFLIGFDYRDITNGERLHVASNKDGHEYFNKCLKNSSRVWMQ